jgi:hypothetical protein
MIMKTKWIILWLLAFQGCSEEQVPHYKDLEQNMMDLKIYQENLGDHIKNKELDDASWLLEGMDSILLVVSRRFEEHHKLSRPFSYFYKRRMKDPIKGIREAIEEKDTAKA